MVKLIYEKLDNETDFDFGKLEKSFTQNVQRVLKNRVIETSASKDLPEFVKRSRSKQAQSIRAGDRKMFRIAKKQAKEFLVLTKTFKDAKLDAELNAQNNMVKIQTELPTLSLIHI